MSKSKGHHAKDLHAKGRLSQKQTGSSAHNHNCTDKCLVHKHVHPVRGMIIIALAAYVFGSLVLTASVVDAAAPEYNQETWSTARVQAPAQPDAYSDQLAAPIVEVDVQPLEFRNGHWNYLVSYQMAGLQHPGEVKFGNRVVASSVVNDGLVETGFIAYTGQTYTITFSGKLDGGAQVLAQQVIQVPLPDLTNEAN